MRIIIIIIISTAAVAMFSLAGAKYFATSKPPLPKEQSTPTVKTTQPTTQPSSPAKSQPTTPSVSVTPTLEQDLQDLMKAVNEAIATGKSQEVKLVVTEAEANAQAASLLTQAQMPQDVPLEIKGAHVDFKPGNTVLIDLETTALGLPVTIKVNAQVSVKDNKPAVDVANINFGLIPLPQSLKDQASNLIKQAITDLLDQMTTVSLGPNQKVILEYKDINIQESQATITVLIKPAA